MGTFFGALVMLASGVLRAAAVDAGRLDTEATRRAPASRLDPSTRRRIIGSIDRGLAYLDRTQRPDGSWSNRMLPAITALAARAYLEHPEGKYDRTSPQVARALAFLAGLAKDGGREGIYDRALANYNTSICLSTLVRAGDPAHRTIIANARRFLADKMIWHENSRGITRKDLRYGGAGYGRHKRPDLSNTQWMVEALAESGLAASDPAFERVVVFIKRCQNYRDADSHPLAGTDGGFFYAPQPPESKAGRSPGGGLKSYGGMTYAGFKSFIYAGLSRDDPRVRAAWNWIRAHYTVEENPELGKQGLFYYYHTMAKALHVYGERFVEDTRGVRHDWRRDLGLKLAALQRPDGSWTNEADRWMEADPALVTAYAVLAMEYCLAPDK